MWHLFNTCTWFNARWKGQQKRFPPHLVDLDEYIMLETCSFLRFEDKMNLILASDHFCYVSPSIDLSVLVICFELGKSKLILSRAGPHIRTLYYLGNAPFLRPFYEVMQHTIENCPNIYQLDFTLVGTRYSSSIMTSEKYFYYFRSLIDSLDYLQFLRLRDCALSDVNSRIISNLPLLTHLDISFNGQITGRYLCQLNKLTYLNLTNCFNLESDHFIEICQSVQLITLSIIGCFELSTEAIEAIERTQHKLQVILAGKNEKGNIISICRINHLRYFQAVGPECLNAFNECIRLNRDLVESVDMMVCEEDDYILNVIPNITNLKRLNLYEMQTTKELLINLTRNCSQLEELTIPNSYINERILFGFLRNLERLKFLDICGCRQMDVNLFRGAVAIMKTRHLKPIKINVAGTLIQEDFLETEEYLKATDFVTLSFDCTNPSVFYHNEHLGGTGCNFSEDIIILQKYINNRPSNRHF